MTNEQYFKNLETPKGMIDVVIDTDAYAEIDDHFAIGYLIRSKEKINVKALYAEPFFGSGDSESPKDGMTKSYYEIKKIMDLMDEQYPVFLGADKYLENETAYIDSPAVRDLIERAKKYSPQNPLYVVGIGVITNIASAIIMDPTIAENMVIVWLGGHSIGYPDTKEFNMQQDIAAARVVMGSGAPFVQLPCRGVVDSLSISGVELKAFLAGKNKFADYLVDRTFTAVSRYCESDVWTRIIWDIAPAIWLLNDKNQFMQSRKKQVVLPSYDGVYDEPIDKTMEYVYYIERDAIIRDMIEKLA